MAAKRITPAENNQGEIVIYQSETGDTKIDVHFVDETVWLTQQQMAELFQTSRTNVVELVGKSDRFAPRVLGRLHGKFRITTWI